IIQGWSANNGVIDTGGPVGDVMLPKNAVSPAVATTTAKVGGNLPGDAATGTVLSRDTTVYDAAGNATQLTVNFTKTAAGWDASYTDPVTSTVTTTNMVFTNGKLTSGTSLAA